jgi:hypothetical protein
MPVDRFRLGSRQFVKESHLASLDRPSRLRNRIKRSVQ